MMKKFITLCSVLALFASAAGADTIVRRAQVLISEPVYERTEIVQPVTLCRNVEVPIYENGGDDIGAFLGGAIIGGIIGNAASNANGAGAIGAIIGGAIANESQKKTHPRIVGYRNERRCETEYRTVQTTNHSTMCRTVVEFPSLSRYRTEFTSSKCYTVGEYISMEVNIN